MSILNITRLPISLFPMSRTAAAEAFNSIARIKKYLLLPELHGIRELTDETNLSSQNETKNENTPLVKIVNGYFDWNEEDQNGNNNYNNSNNNNNTNEIQQQQNQNGNEINQDENGIELSNSFNGSNSSSNNTNKNKTNSNNNVYVRSYSYDRDLDIDQIQTIEIRSRQDSNASIQSQIIEVDNTVDQYMDIPQEDIEMTKMRDKKQGGEAFINLLAKRISNNNSPHPQSRSCTLSKVNLEITNGDLIAIIGSVGAGKTSLLTAILGQMTRVNGSQTLKCRVAYAGQEHWIQNLTLKDNVLFDEPFDEDRYADCLDASQLSTDLVNLPNADYTEIGERGINLSGGQKARVNLARALYASNVNLYLLDDILASVDVHVGKAIFDSAILDLLKYSARVLVLSSNYHLLPYFNKIIVVNQDGFADICTSYGELKNRYREYTTPDGDRKYEELLKRYHETIIEEEEEGEEEEEEHEEKDENQHQLT